MVGKVLVVLNTPYHMHSNPKEHIQPFDLVVLDYKMPKINGMEVAKEIFGISWRQRIVLASAYPQDTLITLYNS